MKLDKPKKTREEMEEEYIRLSWQLIEWKVAYYMPEMVSSSRIDDVTVDDDYYDHKERRYLTLCRRLGHKNTIVHKRYPGYRDVGTKYAMIEIDKTRPSVKLVISKLMTRKRKIKKAKRKITRRK